MGNDKIIKAKVTICVPTYNRAAFLSQTLDSLCDQGIARDEYVVAVSDNASTDRTGEVIASFNDKLQLVYHRNTENLGHVANLGIVTGLSRTPYTVVLPDDDLLAPGQLGRALSAFEKHKDAVLVSSLAVIQQYPGAPQSYLHGVFLNATVNTSYAAPYVWDATEWWALSLINTPLSLIGSVFQTAAFECCQRWKRYPLAGDRLLLAEMQLHGAVVSLPWVGGYYRVGSHQTNAQLIKTNLHEFFDITNDILEICCRKEIPVIEYWVNFLCDATNQQRAYYLRLLEGALPANILMDIRRKCRAKLGREFKVGGRLEQARVPRPIAEVMRAAMRCVRPK